jgi:hypothetical protein
LKTFFRLFDFISKGGICGSYYKMGFTGIAVQGTCRFERRIRVQGRENLEGWADENGTVYANADAVISCFKRCALLAVARRL